MNDVEDRLLKRFTILKRLEYYIEESVYYRSYSEDIKLQNKKVLWHYGSDSGKIDLYENPS